MLLPDRTHSMFLASPEKAQVTVRTLPVSMLMSSGRASILGAQLIDLKVEPSMSADVSWLLELMAYVSEVMEDMLDMDMVSNFISAAMLLKELDSIMEDIMACWAEEEEEEKAEELSSMVWVSFFIIMADDDDDSFWLIIIDPLSATFCSWYAVTFMRMDWKAWPVKEKEDLETPPSAVISQVYSPWSLSARSWITRLQEPSE